jgi:stage III sporulation protein SpoIIIAA
MQKRITDDLHALMEVIPAHIGEALTAANRTDDLLEVILDLGRVPTARYIDSEVILSQIEITRADIDYVIARIGDFDADNRAGLERTLHRISGIRNRRGQVVGLTCRVGRAVYGTIDIVQDIIESGKSILLLGKPGIGKCITGDTLVLSQNGLQPLAGLIPDGLGDDEFAPVQVKTYGRQGLEAASHAYNGGLSATLRITTRQGFTIEGTPEHSILALSERGDLIFRRLDNFKPGDSVAIQRGQQCFGQETRLPTFEFTPRTNALDQPLPLHLTPDLARFLGYLVAEGTLAYDNQVIFCNTEPEIQADMAGLTEALFGLRLRRHMHAGRWNGKDFRIFGVKLRRFLAHLGLTQGTAAAKRIPPCILTAAKPVVTAFLRALFEGDGSVYQAHGGRIEIASASRDLLSQVHVLLLNYGLVGNLRAKHDHKYGRDYYYLTLIGESVVRFASELGFLSTAKQRKLREVIAALSETKRNPDIDVIPHQNDRLRAWRARLNAEADTLTRFTRSDNRAPSYNSLRRILIEAEAVASDPHYQALSDLLENYFFDSVAKIEEGEAYVYDLTVPGTHSFFANGFVSHNTTMLREAARVLADSKRVVIVDTSNEIGGDGDVPHPAVGRARRMQVAKPSLQHEVMIEAVENHNPEVIVIDEIGRELEAEAARTIAERGVQLVGTAHGNTLENLMLNPTLADLVGGIESVTLSDEEARRRGTQKTVLERRAPPTFDVLVEIQDREKLIVHHDVAVAVDALLRGRPKAPELRYRDALGEIHFEMAPEPSPLGRTNGRGVPSFPYEVKSRPPARERAARAEAEAARPESPPAPRRIYAYGIARNRLEQAAKRLRVPALIVEDLNEAQALVTLKTYYRNRQRIVEDAEARSLPIYVLRANTVSQMENFLSDLFNLSEAPADETSEEAIVETQRAINSVLNGAPSVDLAPASAHVRRLQHDMARKANLISHSYGKEPWRRVRIFRD